MTRYKSLDGLRGLAALVVVIHHALLLSPVLSDAYFRGEPSAQDPSWVTTLLSSPVHIMWAGPEAVLLFFVLSGIVLTLPALRPGFAWSAYYPRRLVRLYAPVVAAVLLTFVILRFSPRHHSADFSGWVNTHVQDYSLASLAQDFTLVFGTSGVITPLWSLSLEVIFSLLLPIYVLALVLTLRRKQGMRVAAGVLFAWLVAGIAAQQLPDGGIRPMKLGFFYLSIFAIGSFMALHWPRLSAALAPYFSTKKGRLTGYVILGLAVPLSVAHWMLPVFRPGTAAPSPMNITSVTGVTALVLLAAFHAPFARALEMRPFQWLGKVSFSLYLVHESVMLCIRHAFPMETASTVGLVAVPLSLGIAWGFHRLVESPSQKLSISAGRLGTASLHRLRTTLHWPAVRGRHVLGSTNPTPSDH